MAGRTLTRADLANAVYRKVNVSRAESAAVLEQFFGELLDALERNESVRLSSFGVFEVREKHERIGRNPKTGEEVPIEPRRVVTFRPSDVLKRRINGSPSSP